MSNDQLKLDADALDGFTTQLNGLIQEGSTTLFPASFQGGLGDPGLENVVADVANTDLRVGQRLNSYLTALARLTAASAKSTRDLDHQLATQVTSAPHMRLKEFD